MMEGYRWRGTGTSHRKQALCWGCRTSELEEDIMCNIEANIAALVGDGGPPQTLKEKKKNSSGDSEGCSPAHLFGWKG